MSMEIPASWNLRKLSGSLGAELTGPSINQVSSTEIELLKALLTEHMVLFLPDQSPTIEEHVAFGQHFGDLEGHPNLANPNISHPQIFELVASSGGVPLTGTV